MFGGSSGNSSGAGVVGGGTGDGGSFRSGLIARLKGFGGSRPPAAATTTATTAAAPPPPPPQDNDSLNMQSSGVGLGVAKNVPIARALEQSQLQNNSTTTSSSSTSTTPPSPSSQNTLRESFSNLASRPASVNMTKTSTPSAPSASTSNSNPDWINNTSSSTSRPLSVNSVQMQSAASDGGRNSSSASTASSNSSLNSNSSRTNSSSSNNSNSSRSNSSSNNSSSSSKNNNISGGSATESLTIRSNDEAKIVNAVRDTSKKKATGSIFSIKVDITVTGTLGIGVKDLPDNLLAVSMLKRPLGQQGAGEKAGLRLGDIVFGINFLPTREGATSLLRYLKKDLERGRSVLHLQVWRCTQLCSDPCPGTLFPKADNMFIEAYTLYRNRTFSEWERWNYIEILLSYMMEDLKFRISMTSLVKQIQEGSKNAGPSSTSSSDSDKSAMKEYTSLQKKRQLLLLDSDHNIMQAKGLRTALCVRIVHTKVQADAVLYVLRVEDVESGLQWVVHRRYRDFNSLAEELLDMSKHTNDVAFPKKTLSIGSSAKLVEGRIVALEQYVRRVLYKLTSFATSDPQASQSLRHLQLFLGVDKYIDCVHPPIVDDQRFIELMTYRFLNNFNSPACQHCLRFVTSIDLDSLAEPGPDGYQPVLKHVSQALVEVEQFIMQNHQQQLTTELLERRPDMTAEEVRVFTRKCVRRQVEAAVFLPLRRTVFRIVYSYIQAKAAKTQRALFVLQHADPTFYTIYPGVLHAKKLSSAVKAFRDVIQAYLPADQGQLLMFAATAVAELHTECAEMSKHMDKSSTKSNSVDKSNKGAGGSEGGGAETNLGTSSPSTSASSSASTSALKTIEILKDPVKALFSQEATVPQIDRGAVVKLDSEPRATHSNIDIILNANSNAYEEPQNLSIIFNSFLGDGNNANQQGREGGRGSLVDALARHRSTTESSEDNFTLREAESGPLPMDMRLSIQDVKFLIIPPSEDFVANTNINTSSSISSGFGGGDNNNNNIGDLAFSPSGTILGNDQDQLDSLVNKSDLEDGLFDQESRIEELAETRRKNANNSAAAATSTSTSTSTSSIGDPLSPPPPLFPDLSSDKAMSESPGNDDSIGLTNKVNSNSNSSSGGGSESNSSSKSGGNSDGNNGGGQFNELATSVVAATSDFFEVSNMAQQGHVSADDFLPLFTFVLVQAALPQLLLVKELMVALIDDEETFGECGYYLATLEASTQHIIDLAQGFEATHTSTIVFDDGEEMYQDTHFDVKDLTR